MTKLGHNKTSYDEYEYGEEKMDTCQRCECLDFLNEDRICSVCEEELEIEAENDDLSFFENES